MERRQFATAALASAPNGIARRRLVRPLGAVAVAVALAIGATAASAGPGRVGTVIDGDTFRLTTGERIRIASIDSAETQPGQARCRAEIARGKAATARARALLDGAVVDIERVGRSYNRTVARVSIGGRDVATEFVQRDIARWWPRGQRKPDWCAVGG